MPSCCLRACGCCAVQEEYLDEASLETRLTVVARQLNPHARAGVPNGGQAVPNQGQIQQQQQLQPQGLPPGMIPNPGQSGSGMQQGGPLGMPGFIPTSGTNGAYGGGLQGSLEVRAGGGGAMAPSPRLGMPPSPAMPAQDANGMAARLHSAGSLGNGGLPGMGHYGGMGGPSSGLQVRVLCP